MTRDRSVEELGSATKSRSRAGQTSTEGEGPAPTHAFFEGRIVPFDEARVHILTHAFNYGTAVFEGIRGYCNDERKELYLVRLEEHLARLVANARILTMDAGYSVSELTDICTELVRRNGFRCDVYVRPIIYSSGLRVGPNLNEEQALAVYNIPLGDHHPPDRSLDVMVSSWRRTDDNAIPARGKINGAYVNSALAVTEARRAGFDDAILLNEDGHVSEGSVMNIFLVRDDSLVTPPVTANILEGITRADIMALALDELGLETTERAVDRTELYTADEVFFCGTGAKILPVGSVDRRKVGDGGVGPITDRLRALYESIVHGEDPRYAHWLTPVWEG